MRIINYLAHCQKLGKFTVMPQPTMLKLKVSKTGDASITFRIFLYFGCLLLFTTGGVTVTQMMTLLVK